MATDSATDRPNEPLPLYILAGGRSSRFGSDKAQARLDGQVLIVRVAETLRPVVAGCTVVAAKDGAYAHLGLTTIGDAVPGQGPLGGLLTALQHRLRTCGPGWLCLCACDMAGVKASWLGVLMAQRGPAVRAAAFRHEHWEPLLGLYHTDLTQEVAQRVAQGTLSLQALLDQVRSCALPLPRDWPAIVQINTPEDLRQLLETRGG